MHQIIYRKAVLADCHEIATLKGIVWNTTYKGIYSDASLANYDVLKNQRTFGQNVHHLNHLFPHIDHLLKISGFSYTTRYTVIMKGGHHANRNQNRPGLPGTETYYYDGQSL